MWWFVRTPISKRPKVAEKSEQVRSLTEEPNALMHDVLAGRARTLASAQLSVNTEPQIGPRGALRKLDLGSWAEHDRQLWLEKARLRAILGDRSTSKASPDKWAQVLFCLCW